VQNAFYAYENAVVAAAIAISMPWEENHGQKRKLARQLHKDKHLSVDISDRLNRLNDLRKDVSYGEPGDQLKKVDLEQLVMDLESFIGEVSELIQGKIES
jgi:hypothetical protein